MSEAEHGIVNCDNGFASFCILLLASLLTESHDRNLFFFFKVMIIFDDKVGGIKHSAHNLFVGIEKPPIEQSIGDE